MEQYKTSLADFNKLIEEIAEKTGKRCSEIFDEVREIFRNREDDAVRLIRYMNVIDDPTGITVSQALRVWKKYFSDDGRKSQEIVKIFQDADVTELILNDYGYKYDFDSQKGNILQKWPI